MQRRVCPLCKNDDISYAFKRKDHLSVYLCSSCSLKFVDQSELSGKYGDIRKMYDQDYYEKQNAIGYHGYNAIPVSNFLWQRAFIELISRIDGKKILDIGCGTGKLMELLRERGAEVEGVELSIYAAAIAQTNGFNVVAHDIMQLPDNPTYDIISAFDVIEHIPDVDAFLLKVKSLLKENGVFIFLTPDAGSEAALTQKEAWYGYNSSLEHLHYFSYETLHILFSRIFPNSPVMYQATAQDGEGIMGYIRKNSSADDDLLKKILASNFSPEHINEAVSLPVCVILHRLHDNRIGEYVKKYSSYLESHADTHERTMLFGAVNPGSKEVLLRTYREGDEYALVGLFQKIFGREMTVDEWTWKYKGQGSISVPSTVAVNNIGEIVGHYGGIPLRAVHDNREVKILSTCDVMVHPAFRGFWMLRKLTAFFRKEALNKGFKMCYGFPTEQTLLLPGEKLKILERCLRLSEARKAAGFNNNAARFFYRLSPMDYSDPRINTLWKIFKKSHSFSAVRDCSFLIWRYQKNPIFSYQIWGLTRRWDRKLYGVAVVRNDPSDDMIIMDLVFEERALPALLIKLENLAFTSGKKTLSLWMPERYHTILRENGYILNDYGVLGQIISDDFISKDTIASSFYFSRGDTDYL